VFCVLELEWRGDTLHLHITGDPTQRNYFLFLVVEEKLKPANPDSTQLHSAYRLAVNNQTTLVHSRHDIVDRSPCRIAASTSFPSVSV
jgi:hypothetical protein